MTITMQSASGMHVRGPREALALVFRHKKKVIAYVLAVAALAALIVLFAPRTYRSEVRLFLQIGRESVRLDPIAATGETIALQQSGRDSEIATAIEVFKSRAIVEAAVDKLTPEVVLGESGPGKHQRNALASVILLPLRVAGKVVKSVDPISKREEAVIEVMENFSVDAEYNSAVIAMSYDARTPKLAQQVAQALVDAYREAHVQIHRNSLAEPFFAQQRTELAAQLAAAEDAFRKAKNRVGLVTVDARRGTLEKRLASVELARGAAIQQIASAEASIAALRSSTAAMPERLHTSTVVVPNTGADSLRSQLYSLQVELMNLEAKYKADHPLVSSTRSQVSEAQRMVAEEDGLRERTTDSLNENFVALSLELSKAESLLAGLQAQRQELDDQRSSVLADVKKLNDEQLKLDQLERAVTLANTNFFRYSEGLEQARMDEALDEQRVTNVNEVQPASLSEKPVRPSKLVVAALSLLLMGAGAAAIVIVSEKGDARLRTVDQIERQLNVPVLAVIPESRAYSVLPV